MDQAQKELVKLAKKGRDDLYFLSKEVLGYDKCRPTPHKELGDWLAQSKKRTKLILMPRGSFKSTVVTVGYTIQQLIKDPKKTILISSETQNKAIKFVSEIKNHLEVNPKFRGLYGNWVNKGGTWKGNEFIIKPRAGLYGGKEASVTAGSLEKGASTGLHFDIVVLDDVVSISNIGSEDSIQKTIDHYKLLLSILNPTGHIIVVGTRWCEGELYSWLMDKDGPEYDHVDVFLRTAEDDEGNLLMPEVLNRDFLNQQRKTQGEFIYTCQYLNKVTSSDLNVFKKTDIRYYDKVPYGLIHFITVDPAMSLKAKSDFSAIIVNGVDYKGDWFIREAVNERLEPSALVEKLFELFAKYDDIMCIGMEKFVLEKMLQKSLFDEMEKRGMFIPIKELPTNTRLSKEVRIKALQPMFEQKRVHIRKEHEELYRQLVFFPQVRYDDLLDALKSQLQVVFPSDKVPDNNKPGLVEDINERKIWDDLKQYDRPRRVHSYYEDL